MFLMHKPECYIPSTGQQLRFFPVFTVYENRYAVHVKRTHDGELLH